MHVASLIVLDPSTAPDGLRLRARSATLYEQRLDLAPPFRRRLVEVPFGLHHPVWIEDPDFDLDWHMRHIAVPQPGTHDASSASWSATSSPSRSTAPARCGRSGSSTASRTATSRVLSKVHHAAIDGASGEELIVAILDLAPEIEQKPAPDEPWTPDQVPTDTELVGYAAGLAGPDTGPRRQGGAAHRRGRPCRSASTNRQPDVTPPPSPFTAPPHLVQPAAHRRTARFATAIAVAAPT